MLEFGSLQARFCIPGTPAATGVIGFWISTASALPPDFWNITLRKLGVNIGRSWSRASYDDFRLRLIRGSIWNVPEE